MKLRKIFKTFLFILIFTSFIFISQNKIDSAQTDITNKINVELDFTAERFSDNTIIKKKPRLESGVLSDLIGTIEAGSDGKFKVNTGLGTKSDERDDCVELKGDRRTGTCQDGVYTFDMQSYDAAGNKNNKTNYSIERDTVKPEKPQVTLYLQGGNSIFANITGEDGTEIIIDNNSSGEKADKNGLFLKYGVCESSYTFSFQLKDRAGNVSEEIFASITTELCPNILGLEDQSQMYGRVSELVAILQASWGLENYEPMSDWRGELHLWNDSCRVWVKDYEFIRAGGVDARMEWSDGHSAAVIFYNPYYDKLFVVSNAIWAEYFDNGGPCGVLGLPKPTDGYLTERPAGINWDSSNRGVTSAAYQRFGGGSIYWHWNSNQWISRTHATYGRISKQFETQGGTWSHYGFPISDIYYSADQNKYCQTFEGDRICISNSYVFPDCESYVKGEINYIEGGYESKCGTLLQNGSIHLPSVKIITRNEWGAKYTQENSDLYTYSYFHRDQGRDMLSLMDSIVIHHTTDPQDQTIIELEDKEHKGRAGFKPDSMPYHFIINKDGTIYEGRPLEYLGDHVASQNHGKIGIAVMGDFESRWQNLWSPDTPTDQQIDVLKKLVDDLQDLYNIEVSNQSILGHKDVEGQKGECPGDNLEDKIDIIRTFAKQN